MDHVVDATASGCGGELIGDMAPNVLLSAPCRQIGIFRGLGNGRDQFGRDRGNAPHTQFNTQAK